MSDLLSRRFRDKIHARSHTVSRQTGARSIPVEPIPPYSIRVLGLEHGTVPDAIALNPLFPADRPLVRLTLALGGALQRRTRPLDSAERIRLLALCPGLPLHGCGTDEGILDLLSPLERHNGEEQGDAVVSNGISTAHLIEHVAIELATTAEGGLGRVGATCAHRHAAGRFDILLSCEDMTLGRAIALLATAAVRDLGSPTDRSPIHARCAALLTRLAAAPKNTVVAEDIVDQRGWTLAEAQDALEDLVRLGLLEPVRAPFTFSSSTGVLFRRTTV